MSNRQNLSVVRSEYMRTGGHSISEKSQKKIKMKMKNSVCIPDTK